MTLSDRIAEAWRALRQDGPPRAAVAAGAPGAPAGALDDAALGVVAVHLAQQQPHWVLRRIDHVAYLDDSTLRWHVSVTFRWPEPSFFPPDARPAAGQRIHVPLGLLEKRPLARFDVRDESGAALAVLPTRENGRVSSKGMAALLFALARERLRSDPSDEVVEALVRVVTAQPAVARDILADAMKGELGRILSEEDDYRAFTAELAENFLLLVPAVYEPGQERVLKYTYTRNLPWGGPGNLRNVAARFGLADLETSLGSLRLGHSASYHIEVTAPDDVRLVMARITGEYTADDQGAGPGAANVYGGPAPAGAAPAAGALFEVSVDLDEDGDAPHVSLHARRPSRAQLAEVVEAKKAQRPAKEVTAPADPVAAAQAAQPTEVHLKDTGFATVRFRPQPGFPFSVLALLSVVSVVLLAWARQNLVDLDGQTAVAVLLTLPVLLTGYLARPGEHGFATRLLSGVRLASVVPAGALLIVAMSLGSGAVVRPPAPAPQPASLECVTEVETRGSGRGRGPVVTGLRCDEVAVAGGTRAGTPGKPRLEAGVQGRVDAAFGAALLAALLLAAAWLRTRYAAVRRRP